MNVASFCSYRLDVAKTGPLNWGSVQHLANDHHRQRLILSPLSLVKPRGRLQPVTQGGDAVASQARGKRHRLSITVPEYSQARRADKPRRIHVPSAAVAYR